MKSNTRFFVASCVALITTAMSFAIRGGAMPSWAVQFHLSNFQLGQIDATAFWGFTLAMMFGGPLCDTLGLGRIVALAFLGHLVGILLTIFAWNYWSLYAGTLIFGIANGSVEAACNPLIATLFPDNKTTKLNNFHVWFPGGIVIGGLALRLDEDCPARAQAAQSAVEPGGCADKFGGCRAIQIRATEFCRALEGAVLVQHDPRRDERCPGQKIR